MSTQPRSRALLVPDEALTRLDHATKLVRERRDLWVLKLYPAAAEAGGSFRWVARETGPRKGAAHDGERARDEADRRARGKVRRYAAANGLNRLITCTYAGEGCHDPRQLRRDVAAFFRRLRKEAGSGAFAYVWVPEWHKSGHGLHIHAGVGSFLPKPLIKRSWGAGFVDVRLLGSREGTTLVHEARRAAAYLSKYMGKDVGEGVERGLHRYEVAQGFQPTAVEFVAHRLDQTIQQASEYMGARPEMVWRPEEDAWDGPPVVWVSWASARRDREPRDQDLSRVAAVLVRIALRIAERERSERDDADGRVLPSVDGGTGRGGLLDHGAGGQAAGVRGAP